jgi:hypothetical protein
MSDADRAQDRDALSYPERDAMVATLLGITPERLRTLRRVERKRAGSAKPAGRNGNEAPWQRIDRMSDDALFATFRRREVRARAVSLRSHASSHR